jgi:hypothetical protein
MCYFSLLRCPAKKTESHQPLPTLVLPLATVIVTNSLAADPLLLYRPWDECSSLG